ncbi:MAG: SpoIIE family protein phosphatase [bacterium]|nr:SpoIIE family protein phosphatase [bacterium]
MANQEQGQERPGSHLDSGLPDQVLRLREREANAYHLDSVNLNRLSLLLWLFATVGAGYLIASIANGSPLRVAISGLVVVGDLALLRLRGQANFSRSVRGLAAFIVVAHFIVFQAFHGPGTGAVGFWIVVTPLFAAWLRLANAELLTLFGSLTTLLALRFVVENLVSDAKLGFGWLIGYVIYYVLCAVVGWFFTRRLVRRFLARWRAESNRHRERLRMKQELEYAREIQLSMLPRQAPHVGWLEIAALSLPATEVGGDYYDYFVLDDDRLVTVVGDVTGHGVASGLVLSGVRSGLILLLEELAGPRQILLRVNKMLKMTTTRRMLMTLGVAAFDRRSRELTVATAGHPPLLLRRQQTGTIEEIGRGSLPLGALRDAEYEQVEVALSPEDVVLLYSDGVVEAINPTGEQYGWDRLKIALSSDTATGVSAQSVRDTILRSLWDFKGDAEQLDDVTMVVVRVRHPSTADDLDSLRSLAR